ncbi:MAG: hypothetical protein ACTSQN_03310 [Candidatus Heimdallarchaeota archaeon]
MTLEIELAETIKTKKYRWSFYSFIVNAVSFTTLTVMIVLFMLMHRLHDPFSNYENWVIIVVGISCEIAFLGVSFFDARRRDPSERMFSSSIFTLPVFTLSTIIVCLIYWGQQIQLSFTYGALLGAFSGYLAGSLAYGTFFVKIENTAYRVIFGGWIAIPLGVILGVIFTYVFVDIEIITSAINALSNFIFAGIFWGFWGGTISGVVAVLALYYQKNDKDFTSFFVKLQYYDIQKELSEDIDKHFSEGATELNLEECKFFQEETKKKREKLTSFGYKALIVLFAMNFMVGLLVFTGPKLIRGLIFFMNPWEERDHQRIRRGFYEVIDSVIEPLGLSREKRIIKPLEETKQ